ncbi:MAG: GNAT family N-acetyltransferase [Anaerolineales bacterium]|nr:GNAT family N-acetyltransferase [Anaerolineales bacterium]
MSELKIRPTVAADLPRLMGLDHSITSDTVWQLEVRRGEGQTQITVAFREVRLPREVQAPYPYNPFALADDWKKRSMMFTALGDDLPIGYIGMLERGSASSAWIVDLAVEPRERRRGAASALLAAATGWAEARQHKRLILEAQSKNIAAIRLAQKSAFEFCGYNDQYYLNKDVALYFTKALK